MDISELMRSDHAQAGQGQSVTAGQRSGGVG